MGLDMEDIERSLGSEAVRRALRRAKVPPPIARRVDADDPFADVDGLAASAPPAWRRGVAASALMEKIFQPVRFVVDKYVAEGLTLLAGAPKLGKSWMALAWALGVASGAAVMGRPVEHGDVLYLALEDNQRRLKRRLLHMGVRHAPERLTICTEWPTLDEGCLQEIERWIADVPRPMLIIVDVLAKVRPAANGRDSAYDADYKALVGLQQLAGAHSLAIVVVTHTRKMEADDPFDQVSGTRGQTGAADSVLVLKRDTQAGRVTLYGRGRDIEEIETVVTFDRDSGRWNVIGEATEVARTDERQAIRNAIVEAGKPLTAQEIADITGKKYATVRQTLARMYKADEVEKSGRGLYTCHNGHKVTNQASSGLSTLVCDHVTPVTGDKWEDDPAADRYSDDDR